MYRIKSSSGTGAKKLFLFLTLVLVGGGLVAFINFNNKHNKNNSAFVAGPNQETDRMANLDCKGLKVLTDLPEIFFNRKVTQSRRKETQRELKPELYSINLQIFKKAKYALRAKDRIKKYIIC